MKIFETHAHYDDGRFEDDRDYVIKEIYNSEVKKIVSAGYSLEGTLKNIKLAKKYQFIYTTCGISPNDLNENWEDDINKIDNVLKNNLKLGKIVAVGEIGLDYHYDTDKNIQKSAFIKQIEIANKYKLPIVIHTREAVMDTVSILKEHEVIKRGIFHCCPLNRELVKEALKLGYYISLAGPITFKNSKNADEIINLVPLNKLLVETDSPYLAPEPVRGTRNDSRNLKYILQKIATVKDISIEEIAEITYQNAKKIYQIM